MASAARPTVFQGSKRNAMPAARTAAAAELIVPKRLKVVLVFSAGRVCRAGDVAPRQHALEYCVEKRARVDGWNHAIWALLPAESRMIPVRIQRHGRSTRNLLHVHLI